MTLLEARTLVRQRCDQVNSRFITDAELNSFIQSSYVELYDLLVSRFEDYYIKDPVPEYTLTTTSEIALPADFYKMTGLDFKISDSDWATVQRFMFNERNSRSRSIDRLVWGFRNLSYRIVGEKILIMPTGQAAGTYRLWYITRPVRPTADGDVLTGILDFEEYVIADACRKVMIKEESDPTPFIMEKQALEQRVLAMSANRDAGRPERVSDVSRDGDFFEGQFPY